MVFGYFRKDTKMKKKTVLKTIRVPISLNKYRYPNNFLEKALNTPMSKEMLKTSTLFTQVRTEADDLVRLNSVCGCVKDLSTDYSIAKIDVLNTPMGRIINTVIKEDIPLKLSPYGIGTLKQLDNNKEEVEVEDFKLLGFDIELG